MTTTRTAIVLGGSGSVGTALLRELFHDDGFGAVITLSRRPLPDAVTMARTAGRRLVEKLVPDMKPEPLAAATMDAAREVAGDLEGFSVLGVGAGTAKLTLEERRAVDVALNEAFARALRDSGLDSKPHNPIRNPLTFAEDAPVREVTSESFCSSSTWQSEPAPSPM